MRDTCFSIDRFDREDIIDQHNFPQEVTAVEAHQGQKRKRDQYEDEDEMVLRDEEEIYLMNDRVAIIKRKCAAMNAQVTALKKEFGDNIQQHCH